MVRRRQDDVPKPVLSIWKVDGKGWTVERDHLLEAISTSPFSESEIKNRMGKGYSKIADALEGKTLDILGVKHIEWGIVK